MSKIALILFLLIIIIYVLSYLQLNVQHFNTISNSQLELALGFFDGLKLENNEFTIFDKSINSSLPKTTTTIPQNTN